MSYSFSDLVSKAKELETPLIIYDSNRDDSFVIMGLDSYQKIKKGETSKNKTKENLLDEINKNISLLIKQQRNNKKDLRAEALKKELNKSKTEDTQFLDKKSGNKEKEVGSKIEYDSINEDTRQVGLQEDEIEIEEVEPEDEKKNRKNIPYQD